MQRQIALAAGGIIPPGPRNGKAGLEASTPHTECVALTPPDISPYSMRKNRVAHRWRRENRNMPAMEPSTYPPLSQERMAGIARQWQAFQTGRAVDPAVVRPMIHASWERCRRAKLPGDAMPLCPIDVAALELATAQNRDLVESAKHLMDKLVLSIHLSKSVVTLVDTAGLVLHASATSQDLDNVPYGVPGRRCDEVTIGTNGMGLCIIEQQPVHVIASEHYNASLHYLGCAAAPIRNVAGQLIGALNLAINTENFHQHTLGLVEARTRNLV